MTTMTADLCDAHPEDVRVVRERFLSFGTVRAFSGPCCPVQLYENDVALKALLSQPGEGRVAVVAVLSRQGPAVFGEGMAALAERNGWAGVLVDGAVRDVATFDARAVGIRACATAPFIVRTGPDGAQAQSVRFAGIAVTEADHAFVDDDGIVFLASALQG